MAPEFIPFRATPEKLAAQKVLRDGVPDSMRASIVAWLSGRVIGSHGHGETSAFREMEVNLDWNFRLPHDRLMHRSLATESLNALTEEQLLQAVHYWLHRVSNIHQTPATSMRRLLEEGRSKWTVDTLANGRPGLVERVPRGVQTAVEKLIADGGSAGELLADAWRDAYDFQPRDSSAYANAVKAVEAVGLPAMGLRRDTATLGDMARLLDPRATGKEVKWRLPFLREHSGFPSQEVLLGMLRALYRGQRDRHGAEAYEGVTHDEAVAAVLMAVSLVGWFSGGLVQERDPKDHPA